MMWMIRLALCLPFIAACDSNDDRGGGGNESAGTSSNPRTPESARFASWPELDGARVGDWAAYTVERRKVETGPAGVTTVASDPFTYKYTVAAVSPESVKVDLEVANSKWGTSFRASFEIRTAMTRLDAMRAEVSSLQGMPGIPRSWDPELELGPAAREEGEVLIAEGVLRGGAESPTVALRIQETREAGAPIFGRRTLETRYTAGAAEVVVRFDLVASGDGVR